MLFLISLEFAAKLAYYILVLFATIVFCSKKINFNSSLFMLLLVSLSYFVFGSVGSDVKETIKNFMFPMAYIIGFGMLKNKDDFPKGLVKVKAVFAVLATGMFLHFFCNALININSRDRNVYDIWNRLPLSATIQAALACAMIGLSTAVLFANTSILKKILAAGALTIIVAYNLALGGRAIFALIIIAFLVALIYKNIKTPKKLIKNLLIISLVVVLIALLFLIDFFGVRSFIEGTAFYNRFFGEDSMSLGQDARLGAKIFYLKNMFKSLWGGQKLKALYGLHAHDLYFDTFDQAGIFALVGIISYVILSIVRLIKVLRSEIVSSNMKLVLLCIYITIHLQFWLEPIIQGVPVLFVSYCIMDGAVTALLKKAPDSL